LSENKLILCIFIILFLRKRKSGQHHFFLTYSGLCTILRSEAGGQDEAIARGCEDDPAYRNNAHLVDDGDLSNHVGYYDAAALYPSSGE